MESFSVLHYGYGDHAALFLSNTLMVLKYRDFFVDKESSRG